MGDALKDKAYQHDPIDDRLKRWGDWAWDAVWSTLGIPRETLIYKMVRSGIIAHGQGYFPEPENQEEAITDKAVTDLSAHDKRIGDAIKLYYIAKGTPRQKAADLGVSVRSFNYYVEAGRKYIERWLDSFALKK